MYGKDYKPSGEWLRSDVSKPITKNVQSAAYRAGWAGGMSGYSTIGHGHFSPSITEREMWGHDWSEFMRGFNAAINHAIRFDW